MSKQRILTAVATVFSLLIAFGGWFLTNELLNRQHLNLMNTVHSINVEAPPEDEQRAKPTRVTLSNREIANILRVWGSGQLQTQRYHDPFEGQLTMEEAIEAANSGLSYFCDNDVLPKELLESDFTKTNAFLYDIQSPRAISERPAPDPAYSFWSVNLSNREVSVQLTLNAQTGRIWMADIRSSSKGIDFNDKNALDVLKQYEAYLGLSSDGRLRGDEAYATQSYDNNQIGINVYKKAGESGRYELLHFSLTSTR